MKLPDKFTMRRSMFGDGAKGYALQQSRDAEGLAITLIAVRAKHGAPWIKTWTFDFLPDRAFANYAELRQVVEALPDEDIAAEQPA